MTRLVLLALLVLPGCQTLHDLVGVDPNPVASEVHRYDGSYQGFTHQVVSRSPLCSHEHGEAVLQIGDSTLWYSYTPDIIFTAPVERDGTINGRAGANTLVGKISGNHLDATVTGLDCKTSISMDYVYNHS